MTRGKVRPWFWVIKTYGTLVSEEIPVCIIEVHLMAAAPLCFHRLQPLEAHLSHHQYFCLSHSKSEGDITLIKSDSQVTNNQWSQPAMASVHKTADGGAGAAQGCRA